MTVSDGPRLIVAGVDVGAKNVHVVLVGDGEVIARAAVPSGFDQEESAERGLVEAARVGGVARDEIALCRGHWRRSQGDHVCDGDDPPRSSPTHAVHWRSARRRGLS